MELNALLEKYRKELRDELEMKLQACDRLVISTNKMGTAVKSIKSKDLILFKTDEEQLTLADMLVEYKVLVKLIIELIDKNEKLECDVIDRYRHLSEQFINLLKLFKSMSTTVELMKQEVLI